MGRSSGGFGGMRGNVGPGIGSFLVQTKELASTGGLAGLQSYPFYSQNNAVDPHCEPEEYTLASPFSPHPSLLLPPPPEFQPCRLSHADAYFSERLSV